jgi:hypothetical protein
MTLHSTRRIYCHLAEKGMLIDECSSEMLVIISIILGSTITQRAEI